MSSKDIFSILKHVFRLMGENMLRKDIDDTLLEKLMTLFRKYSCQPSLISEGFYTKTRENNENIVFDFIEELVKRTEALLLIEKVLSSVSADDEKISLSIKTFVLRFLGLIFESPKMLFSYQNLDKFSLFKNSDGKILTHYVPSIQSALLSLLSGIIKQFDGVLWFINQNLEDFVFSSFNSTSYYVRRSAVNFYVSLISQWIHPKISPLQGKEAELLRLEAFLKKIMFYITKQIHLYNNSKDIISAECCISITKQLLNLRNIENIMGSCVALSESIAECFKNLPEEREFNEKLTDLFLAIHNNSTSKIVAEMINDVIKSLIANRDIILAFYLLSSYVRFTWPKCCSFDEIKFFLLPIYILTNKFPSSCQFFGMKSNLVYDVIQLKMENKSDCKNVFASALSSLQNLVPLLDSEQQRNLGIEIFKIVKSPDCPRHKWLHSVLDDRRVHHSFLELFESFLSDDVYPSLIFEGSDIIFMSVIELLQKPTSDCNFLSRLLLLMKDILILHEKFEYNLENDVKNSLVQILSRKLLDKRESVIDSSIHLAGQIINNIAWQEQVSEQGIHSIIWDIAVNGSHDGSIRSTALKVVVESCLESRCFNEVKSLKGITEADMVKILFDLTQDPDFFLQREALSCLFVWMKSKWNILTASDKDNLFSALVSAIKSLDLEMKLLSLNIWLWFIQHKLTYPTPENSDTQNYIEYLANCGFGLSLIFALEDYDNAVCFKAANILYNLQNKLISNGQSYDTLKIKSTNEKEPEVNKILNNSNKIFSEEERDKGIDAVLKLTTAQQITKICQPLNSAETFKNHSFIDNEDRSCSTSTFWAYIWSEKLALMLHPTKIQSDTNLDAESLLNDIIAAKVSEDFSVEDIPDCY